MAYTHLTAPSPIRPTCESRRNGKSHQIDSLLLNSFHSTTLLLFGAILQGTLVLFIPRFWGLLSSLIVLLIRFADTLAITFHFRPNPYLEDVIYEKWTNIIPDTDGNFSDTPADEKVAVLLLSAKFNHPLGFFAPNVKGVGGRLGAMIKEIDSDDISTGFLGQSSWRSTDVRGVQEHMQISYWRSIEDILAYANGPTHLETIQWWNHMMKKDPENMKHIGIAHEIFEAPRSKWETINVNFQPARLGATTYLKKGDKLIGGVVDDQWVSPIVEARGRLGTSNGRLNWSSNMSSSTTSSGDEKTSY